MYLIFYEDNKDKLYTGYAVPNNIFNGSISVAEQNIQDKIESNNNISIGIKEPDSNFLNFKNLDENSGYDIYIYDNTNEPQVTRYVFNSNFINLQKLEIYKIK